MNLIDPVQISQTVGNVNQLERSVGIQSSCCGGVGLTRLIRFISGYFRVKSRMFPFSIHGETIQSGKVVIEAP